MNLNLSPFGNPFTEMDRWLLGMVRFLESALYKIIVKPEELFGQAGLAKTLLEYVWPIGPLLAVVAVATILSALVLTIRKVISALPHLILPLLIFNAGSLAFWMLLQSWQIGVTRPLAVGVMTFGTGSDELTAQKPLFPDVGVGGQHIVTHLAWLIILLIPVILAACVSFGQIVSPAVFSFSAGLYAFGHMARRFFVSSLLFLVIAYTVGSPLIAIAYRLILYSNDAVPNLFWRTIAQLIVVGLAAWGLVTLFTLVKDRTVEVAKETKSKVRGMVDSLTKRGSKTDANIARPVKVNQKKASQPRQQSASMGGKSASNSAKASANNTQGRPTGKSGGMQFGSLTVGRKPAPSLPAPSGSLRPVTNQSSPRPSSAAPTGKPVVKRKRPPDQRNTTVKPRTPVQRSVS